MKHETTARWGHAALGISALLSLITAANICSAPSTSAEQAVSKRTTDLNNTDALGVDSKHFHFQFENRQIRVLRLTLRGNEFVPMHSSPDALLVCVNGCHIRLNRPDKRIHDIHMDEGETRWVRSCLRSEKNLSDKPVEIVIVEFKEPAQ